MLSDLAGRATAAWTMGEATSKRLSFPSKEYIFEEKSVIYSEIVLGAWSLTDTFCDEGKCMIIYVCEKP